MEAAGRTIVDSEKDLSHSSTAGLEAKEAISWPLPPKDWANQPGSTRNQLDYSDLTRPSDPVHLWAASLDVPPALLATLADLLAPDEHERADRFHFPVHRNRFIVGRGILRSLLGRYLDTNPGTLKFSYGCNGKPALDSSLGAAHLSFNLAHTEDLLVIGVTRGARIGVDVERVRALPDFEELVTRFFSHNECSTFREVPFEHKPAAFFNLWTRKEAWLKATGEGIAHLLNQVEVSFQPGEPVRLLQLPASYVNSAPWSLSELSPRLGFAGALAVDCQSPVIQYWQYQHA